MTEEQVKKCTRCEEEKSLIEYNKRSISKDGFSNICRDCTKAESKKYIGRYKSYKSEYYLLNKDQVKEKVKTWSSNNKSRQKANHKQWSLSNQDKLNKIRKTWVEKNPQKARLCHILSTNKRRQSKMSTENRATIKEINKLIEDSNNICFWCDEEIPVGKLHLDHIYPLSKNGKDNINNLAVSCERCNCRKGAKNPEDFLEEILLDK